ncbi:hypothetical protein [Sphingomonas prati]|uniref:Uncharacterized protein n=1 Tax=Sphingomonas prati TaxID=1843237 RepID=A0A7W9BUF2_9SPHN|nr:hypothetical protein [Sphingomonas prati]MBB5730320.1 hypothetical protein [Sphingomonas prati]GGE93193.1 hypothetical protein GCM10011404_27740 [Sphingomonas prati]
MIAIGCLALLVLPLTGLACGGWIAGPDGAIWGAAIGFGLALGVCGFSAYALRVIGRRP